MAEYHRIGANKPLRGEENKSQQQRRPDVKSDTRQGESRGVKKPTRPTAVPVSPVKEEPAPLPSIRKEKMATPAKSIETPGPRREMYLGEIEVILDGGDEENDIDVLKHMRNIREQNDLRSGRGVSTSYTRNAVVEQKQRPSQVSLCRYLAYRQGRVYTPVQIENGLVPEVTDLLCTPTYKSQLGLDKIKLTGDIPEVEVVLFAGGTRDHVGLDVTEIINWNMSRVKFLDPIANYMSGIICSRGLISGIVENCRLIDGVLLNESGTCTIQILTAALSNCVTRARSNQNLCVLVLPVRADIAPIQQYLSDLKKLGVFVLMPGVFSVGAYDYQRLQPISKESADIYLPGKNVLSLASKEYYTVIDGEIPAYAQLAAIIGVLTQKLLLETDDDGQPKYRTRSERYEAIYKLIMEDYSYCPKEGYRIFQIR